MRRGHQNKPEKMIIIVFLSKVFKKFVKSLFKTKNNITKVGRSILKCLFFHTLWRTVLNLGPAWPADVCAPKTQKNINKPAKGHKRIII